MIDESLKARVGCALEQGNAESSLRSLAQALAAEGISRSELIALYHESLIEHIDDIDQSKHNALQSALSVLTGVQPTPARRSRPWTMLRKAQVAAACFGAVLTVSISMFPQSWVSPNSAASHLLFNLWALVFALPGWIAYVTGIGPSVWGFPLALAVNAAVCVVIVTVIGWFVSLFRLGLPLFSKPTV